MKRFNLPVTLALFSGLAASSGIAAQLRAQSLTTVATLETPSIPSSSAAALPDAPSALYSANPAPADIDAPTTPSQHPVAGKFDTIILPGQTAQPLHGAEKIVYALHDSFNVYALVGVTLSAGYSQVVGSQPHYGAGIDNFGKREGAAALRNTIQTMTTDALFAPIFHDDPRYYVFGNSHSFIPRVFYAASRVVVTRSSSGNRNRINAPLLMGYAAAAGANNAYYPDQDRGGKNTAENFGTSLAGAAIGFEVSEFLDDTLRALHIRKN